MIPLKMMLAKLFLRQSVWYGVAGSDLVYLTFDDGPNLESTPRVLDVLDRHGVKATFFMVGRDVRKAPALAQEVAARGHTIGNHSLTHARMDRLSGRARGFEIQAFDGLMDSAGQAYRPALFRPPYGYVSLGLVQTVRRQDRKLVMWSRDSMDFRDGTTDVIDRFERQPPRPGDILLFHDDSVAAAPALEVLLPRWKGQGLLFGMLVA